jgi:ABC-type nitrate/sulfonate/bicarbonate transport system substrate-binding protein
MSFRFSTTPFFNTRQFYYPLEAGLVETDVDLAVEHNHSPRKDQKLLCGGLDATTMSMGKYVTANLVSHTEVLPVDPQAIAAGLTYREGNGLFVAAGGAIEEPADLAGARVGIHDTTLAMTYHKAALEEHFGVDPADVEWVVDTHQELGRRMDAGELDAVERINDWYWGLRAGEDYRLLYDVAQAWHAAFDYYPLVHLVTVDDAVRRDDPALVASFLDALRRSRAYTEANRDAVIEAMLAEDDSGEWSGERTVEAVREVVRGVDCPFELGAAQRQNVRDWMRFADRYGVFASTPLPDDRLFPTDDAGQNG